MQVDTVVLDIDGVLVDVSNSYRRATVSAVEVVYGEEIDSSVVQSFKIAGGFNNDWDLTSAIGLWVLARDAGLELEIEAFAETIAAAGGGLEGAKAVIEVRLGETEADAIVRELEADRLRDVFQQLYLGPAGYRELEGGEPDLYAESASPGVDLPRDGLMADEPILVTAGTIEALQAEYAVGVLTGRPRAEAQLALDRIGLSVPAEHCFAMEDGPGKPDPTALEQLAENAGASAVAFAGDTLDDVATARNAALADPDRTYYGLGVLTGGLTGKEGRAAFQKGGADAVIDSVEELPAVLSPIEKD
ncbi:MAG: TIGR01548 family HAD-type hydrolase [Halodesulfurarchaeum sp.]